MVDGFKGCDLTGSRGSHKVRHPRFAIDARPTSPQSKMNTKHQSQEIDQLQLEAYRQLTGEERLRIGLGLYEASRGVAREAIRNRLPRRRMSCCTSSAGI